MPLVYQQNINVVTKLGVWHITEEEDFFLKKVPLQRKITHWHKRLQHLAGRLLLIELFPAFPVELIRIADTRKPYLPEEPYHFSISHCGDYAAVIVSRENRVGVDVELLTDKVAGIMHKFLSPIETNLLPISTFHQTALLCWSVKETIFKWIGVGEVDFIRDIVIKKITGDDQGWVNCQVYGKQELVVHFLYFDKHYLTWVVTV